MTELDRKIEIETIRGILLEDMFPNYMEAKGEYSNRVDRATNKVYDFIHKRD